VQRLSALEREREHARLVRQPTVCAPHPTVARATVSGYGMSHGKVFTVSTQGARANPPDMAWRTNSQLGGGATWRWKLTGADDGAGAQRR
jgi:hypothetical protein